VAILNLDGGGSRGPKFGLSKIKTWMGISVIVAVLGIGSTLASTITVNSNQPTEFGQGVSRTVYCGGQEQSLTVTPISSYVNDRVSPSPSSSASEGSEDTSTVSAGSFNLGGITVSNIPTACSNIDFLISAYDDGATSSPLDLLPHVTGLAVLFENNTNQGSGPPSTTCKNPLAGSIPNCVGAAVRINTASYGTLSGEATISSTSTSFTILFPLNDSVSTDLLGRIVIETQKEAIATGSTISLS